MRVIHRAGLPMAIETGGVEFRMDRAGEQSVAWVRLPKAADLRPGLVGLPGDLCPCPHRGYMISGRLVMHGKDGDQIYEADQAFYCRPAMRPRRSRTVSTSTCPRARSSSRSFATCRPLTGLRCTGRLRCPSATGAAGRPAAAASLWRGVQLAPIGKAGYW